MTLRFPVLEAGLAYLGSTLFLPKSAIAEAPIRAALTFGIDPVEAPRTLVIDHPHHIEVPRNFKPLKVLKKWGLEVVDLRNESFARSSLRPKAGFGFRPHQVPAWKAMRAAARARQDFTLRLATGRGKTVMGLRLSAEIGGPLLVVSWQEAHLKNWEKDLRKLFELDSEIGWIKGKRLEYDREVVFCTVQTLARRIEAGVLPPDFYTRFALTIYDEVHHMAARWFCVASEVSQGQRLGLTATLKRKDRCEGVVTAQIGRVIYDDPEEDTLVPTIFVNKTTARLEDDDPDILDVNGVPHIGKMRVKLVELDERNRQIVEVVKKRLRQGHLVYVASHSVELAYEIEELLHQAGLKPGLITGDEKDADVRMRELANHEVVVVTVGVGKENYNKEEMSSLVLATPLPADSYAPTAWLQLVGRILRPLPGKLDPIVDLFFDEGISQSKGLTYSALKWCHDNNWEIEGDAWTSKQQRSRKAWQV